MVAAVNPLSRPRLHDVSYEFLQHPWQFDCGEPAMLVVLDSAPMADDLARAFKATGVWLLRVANGRVPPVADDRFGIWKALDFAVETLGVRRLLISGHPGAVAADAPRGFAGLIGRATWRQRSREQAKRALVDQVDALRDELSRRWSQEPGCEVKVAAVFYSAKSEQFLCHDPTWGSGWRPMSMKQLGAVSEPASPTL